MLSILALEKPGESAREVQPDELSALIHSTEAIAWVRCLAPADPDLLWLRDTFGFHPLTIEDCRQRNQRPKIRSSMSSMLSSKLSTRSKKVSTTASATA